MQETDIYSEHIIKAILSAKGNEIRAVSDIACISSAFFDRDQYPALLSRLKNGETEGLTNDIGHTENTFREYLYVYHFFDQDKRKWFATIYDSDELWQDPELIDLVLYTDGFR